jgi:hypothetical protein
VSEPEILIPVKCPICSQESLTGFRVEVVADALATGDIRLYTGCHVASWDASEADLKEIREFLDVTWSENMREACDEFSLDDPQNEEGGAFNVFGDLETHDDSQDGHAP